MRDETSGQTRTLFTRALPVDSMETRVHFENLIYQISV